MAETKQISDNRQIARNLIFNTISFAINFVISFFFTPYLIRTVGKEAYSFFPLVNNIIGYSSILTTAVGSMAGRFIIMKIYNNDIENANKYFNSVWVANIVLSVFFTLLCSLGIVFIDKLLTVPNYLLVDVQLLFLFGTLTMILGLLTGMFGLGTFVKNRIDMQASINVITNLTRIICILLLFWLFTPTIVFMSLSAMIAAIVGVYFNVSLKKKLLPELTIAPRRNFSWKHLKETMSSSIWNSVNQLSNVLLGQVDLLITNIFIGAAATGDYALAKTAPMLILNLLAMLSGAFAPHFNILYAKGQIDKLVNEIKKSMMIVSLIIGLPIGFLLVFSGDFFILWVPGQDVELLYWLSFWTVLKLICGASINPIYGVFSAVNKLKTPSVVVLFASTLQTVLILILLKTTNLGIWTIPIVAGIQAILRNSLFTTIYGAQCLNQKWNTFFPTLFRGIGGMLVVVFIGIIVKQFIVIDSWVQFFITLVFVCTMGFIINCFLIVNKAERMVLTGKILNEIKKFNHGVH